jgi:hypothetical protein
MATHKPTPSSAKPAPAAPSDKDFAFGKQNYVIMLAGIAVIITGFLLMTGGGSEDPRVFSQEIFSTRRILVAPLVVLLGFGIEVYAIVKKARD